MSVSEGKCTNAACTTGCYIDSVDFMKTSIAKYIELTITDSTTDTADYVNACWSMCK